MKFESAFNFIIPLSLQHQAVATLVVPTMVTNTRHTKSAILPSVSIYANQNPVVQN